MLEDKKLNRAKEKVREFFHNRGEESKVSVEELKSICRCVCVMLCCSGTNPDVLFENVVGDYIDNGNN